MITFKRVHYQYPRQARPVIDDFTGSIQPGEFVVVTGPSGSGKSTLARFANGLIPHFYGGIFGGHVSTGEIDTRASSTSALSRLVGFVAQDPESQTVTDRVDDEIAFGPENFGLSQQQIRLRVEETIDLLSLANLRGRELATLSGGERQRVVIAAAIAMRPPVLVLDEPTSQLDPWGAEEIVGALERLNADLGMTIILIEHRLERVLAAADRLMILGQSGRRVDLPVQEAIDHLAQPPALIRLARALEWHPVPLSVRAARALAEPLRSGIERAQLAAKSSHAGGAAVVEIEKLSFNYGQRLALREISTSFRSGSVTALMGRNGSGKTTLLKQVNGLLRPASGRVRVHGTDIAGRQTNEVARQVAYLPQHPGAMLFNESVAAEIAFTLRCRGTSDDVDRLLERLGLQGLRERNPFDLSGGERQRAALAATLAGRPSVVLLDEPTRGMDVERKHELGRLLRDLAAEGNAIVVATHDAELVSDYADRVVLMAEGEIIADGSPAQVLPESLTFTTQINRVFGGPLLTVEHVLDALKGTSGTTITAL